MNETNETTHSECVTPKKKRKDTTIRKIAREAGVSENTMRKMIKMRALADFDSDMNEIITQGLAGEVTISDTWKFYQDLIHKYQYLADNFEKHLESFDQETRECIRYKLICFEKLKQEKSLRKIIIKRGSNT